MEELSYLKNVFDNIRFTRFTNEHEFLEFGHKLDTDRFLSFKLKDFSDCLTTRRSNRNCKNIKIYVVL